MLRSTYTFFVCFTLFLAALHPAHPHAVNGEENHSMVGILDPELRKRVAASFSPPKAPNDPITANDMKDVRSVSSDTVDIRHLTGLEHAINLTYLQLLRSKPQTQAVLNARPSFDLTPLSGLTKLEYLSLQGVVIFDMAPLRNLTALKNLGLIYTYGISEIPDLSKLTKLVHLRLHTNRITDISGVSGLTNLRQLDLSSNSNLSDISPLTRLRNLEILRLDGNARITHESLSAVLPHLSTEIDQELIGEYMEVAINSGQLGLGNTNISDLSVLDRLPNVFLYSLVLNFMGTRSSGTIFFHLTDLTPLVDLMNKGKVINSGTKIYLQHNLGLDYESLYADLPLLIAGSRNLNDYAVPAPLLEIEPPPPPMVEIDLQEKTEASYRGHPRARYTFSVRAVNTNPRFPSSWLGLTPHGTAHNRQFENVPVTFTVTNPDGTTEEQGPVLTGADGLAPVTMTLGDDGETHTVVAVVPEKTTSVAALSHPELSVRFTVTADQTVEPPPPPPQPQRRTPLTVTFENYPEEKPTDEFTLTIRFSQPVIGFEKEDITVETELTGGKEDATVVDLTPETPIHPDRPDPDPIQTYTATVQLPDHARGSVRLIVRADAATNPMETIGPASDTASDPIDFGRRVVIICPPSVVPMDRVIFNEFRNASDDRHDWIELKNISDEPVSLTEWEISLVVPHAISPAAPHWEILAMDRDVAAFGDYTLPAGGILLIVNTHPSETELIRGQNIENPNRNPDLLPHYLIAPEMKLPSSFLLILRRVRDKNGKYEGFEDLVGDYHKDDVNYATNIWPLRCTPVYTGTAARFTVGDVYQRVMAPKFSARTFVSMLQPEKRGYLEGAWTLSESHGGLGYDPGASVETSLGTPGYAVSRPPSEKGWETISFSEVMYATNDNGGFSQWIELYNRTTEIVDLTDWRLVIEARDSKTVQRWTSLRLKSLHIGPNQTVLLVGRTARSSGNIPADRIYDLYRRNTAAFRRLGEGANRFLGSEGFALRLFSPDGTLVDVAGNLDGRRTPDTPKWQLPDGWTETGARTSLIRAYDNRVPGLGTVSESFVRAADTALLKGYSYWGLPTDNGTPGYRQGSPLPVTLSSVRAERAEGAVVVKWTTASEMENAGFYLWRSQNRKTGFVKVNPTLILGAGTTPERQRYTYRDTTAQPNLPYYYRLEEVSLSGQRRAVATVRLRGHLSAVGKTLYKWADLKVR